MSTATVRAAYAITSALTLTYHAYVEFYNNGNYGNSGEGSGSVTLPVGYTSGTTINFASIISGNFTAQDYWEVSATVSPTSDSTYRYTVLVA